MSKRIALLTILSISIFLVCITGSVSVAYADSELEFDKTYVLDDLEGSAVDGVPFNVADYPYSVNKDVEMLSFVEYCYSPYDNLRENYGLYIYLYNPALLDVSDSSCMVELGIGVSTETAMSYDKYYLKIVSKSTGIEANRFIKFKVLGINNFITDLNSDCRQYYISGLELVTYGSVEAVEYEVSQLYSFTGYAKGYGPGSDNTSTLVWNSQKFDSIEITGLSDRQTVYRDNLNNENITSHNQVNGVYFSLDNKYFLDYGYLQKIKADWYEYRTNPIIVVNNNDVYNALKPWLGVDNGGYTESLNYALVAGRVYTNNGGGLLTPGSQHYSWSYNAFIGKSGTVTPIVYSSDEQISKLSWLLYRSGDISNNYRISENELKSYINQYNSSHQNSIIVDGSVKYSADLFNSNVGAGRSAGHNIYEFDAEADKFDFVEYDPDSSTYNTWERLLGAFGWSAEKTVALKNQSPIFIIDGSNIESCFIGSASEVAERLLCDVDEVSSFETYCRSEVSRGKKVVHFRFACTEYLAKEVEVYKDNGTGAREEGQAFLAQENVFLNFDIISLTFNDNGVQHVVPVVMDPVDIISDIVGPVIPDNDKWQEVLKIIIAILLGMILLVLLYPILPYLIKGIVWVITLPFKLIKSIINVVSSESKNKRE